MSKEVSNNSLIILAMLAIALSAFSIIISLEKLGVTGAVSTGVGYTNVTVSPATDITVVRAQINFTDANPGATRDSYDETHIASDCTTALTCGINITNDGNVEINISMMNTDSLFDSLTLSEATHYLYNITLGDNTTAFTAAMDCSAGGSQGLEFTGGSGWRAFPTQGNSEIAVCCLNNTDSHDSVQIGVNITVPGDEPFGIKSGVITFTASAWA